MDDSIEQLPLLVAEKKISKKEAADIIWKEIYLAPPKFGLQLSEDKKSDFLLFLRERMETLFDEFIPGKIKFRTFIWGLARNTYSTWRRKMKIARENEETTQKTFRTAYEDICSSYYEQEFMSACAPESEDIKEEWKKKEREIAEKATLILALKTCHEINEELVESVSKFTHIEKQELMDKIDKLKEKSIYKKQRRDQIIRRRDNAFYYHRKYLVELSKLKKGSSSFARVEKKYQQQTERWKRQNQLLAHRFVLAPTNSDIADELGMKPRQVCFYINHIKRKKASFREQMDEVLRSEKELDGEEENNGQE